jgi:hypothetical protein
MVEADTLHGDKRATLEAMGAARVRALLDQGRLVHHLNEPAMQWLAELDAKKGKPDAAEPEDQPEHPPEDRNGAPDETG